MRVVTPRSLPADLPKSAIPGIMKPTMIRGIVKPKKLPKIELNVAKILTILGKLRFPITIPKIIGSIINVGVRKYSFLTPFLHKKVDIDGIHSYN